MVKFGGDPGYSPGAIRNTLGSGLKASGFFQKDGQIQNSRGGFIGAKQQLPPLPQLPQLPQLPHSSPQQGGAYFQGGPNQGMGYTPEQGYDQGMANNQDYYRAYNQGQARQLILQPAQEGINGNGVATISPDNIFLLIANLPVPQAFLRQGQPGVYAAYLVDDKGKTGFLVGVLRAVGNGVYRAHFQSPVPLLYYSRVVVSVENPAQLGQAPNGPIILKVKEPMSVMAFLNPVKNTATNVWGKLSGLISGRKKPPISPETIPSNPELFQSLNPMGGVSETGVPPIPPISQP